MKLDSRIFLGIAAVAGIALAASSGLTGDGDPPASPASGASGTSGDASGQLPEGHPDISAMAPGGGGAAATADMTGTVEETMDAAGYTYVRLSTDDGDVWVAGPQSELEAGQQVSLYGIMEMGRFESAALERTFEKLYFADRFVVGSGASPAAAPRYAATVLQAIPASRYVYLEVEMASREEPVWLAAEAMEVAEGDRVEWQGGAVMRDFHSSTLERTFDEVVFVGRIGVAPGD